MQGEIDAQILRYGTLVQTIKRSPAAVLRALDRLGDVGGVKVVFPDPGQRTAYLRLTPTLFRELYATGYLKEPVRLSDPTARQLGPARGEHAEEVPALMWKLRTYHRRDQPLVPHPPVRPGPRASDAARRQRGPRKKGAVYIFAAEGTSRIKIGRSAAPAKRKHAIHTASPFAIQQLRIIPTEDTVGLEATLHARYAVYRRHREWFELPVDVLQALLNEIFV